jgi:hypothetical protein
MARSPTPPPRHCDDDTDSDPTPRASQRNPPINYDRPPPTTAPPRTEDAPHHYSDDDLEEQERRSRESRPFLKHAPPPQDEENPIRDSSPVSHVIGRSERREGLNLADWTECFGIWLLLTFVVFVFSGAAAMIRILATQ